MRAIGAALWIIGATVFAIGCALNTAIGDIANIALQQQQMIVVSAGLAMFVAGAVVHAIGHALAVVRPAPTAEEDAGEATVAAPNTDIEIAEPNAEEEPHMAEIRLLGIRRTPAGYYRYGQNYYERLEHALRAGRAGRR